MIRLLKLPLAQGKGCDS